MNVTNGLRMPSILRGVIAGGLVLSMLAACGDDDDSNGEGSRTTATTEAEEPVELSGRLSIVGSESRTGEGSFLALAVEAFEAEHPDVDVTLEGASLDSLSQTLPAQISAGNAPDVISTVTGYGLPIGALALGSNDQLVDLSGEDWADRVPERIAEQVSLDGALYSLPTDMLTVGLHYDPELFATEGLEPPATFEDLLALCAAAVENGTVGVSLAAGEPFVHQAFLGLGLLGSEVEADNSDFTAERLAGDTTFVESEGFVRTLEKVREMNDAKCFGDNPLAVSREAAEETFATGRAYMLVSYSLGQTRLEPLAPDNGFKLIPFPADSAGASMVPMGPVVGLTIPKSGPNVDLATAFVSFVAENSEEIAAQTEGTIPVVVADPDNPPPWPEFLSEIEPLVLDGRTTIIYTDAWPYLDVVSAWDLGFAGVLQGSREPADVLEEMDSTWDAAE